MVFFIAGAYESMEPYINITQIPFMAPISTLGDNQQKGLFPASLQAKLLLEKDFLSSTEESVAP